MLLAALIAVPTGAVLANHAYFTRSRAVAFVCRVLAVALLGGALAFAVWRLFVQA